MTAEEKLKQLESCSAAWRFLSRAGLYWSCRDAERKPDSKGLLGELPESRKELEESSEARAVRAEPWGAGVLDPALHAIEELEKALSERERAFKKHAEGKLTDAEAEEGAKRYARAVTNGGVEGFGCAGSGRWRGKTLRGCGACQALNDVAFPLFQAAFRHDPKQLCRLRFLRVPLYMPSESPDAWADYERKTEKHMSFMYGAFAHAREGLDADCTLEESKLRETTDPATSDLSPEMSLANNPNFIRLTDAASNFDIPKATLSRLSEETRPGRPHLTRHANGGGVYLVREEVRRLQLSRQAMRRNVKQE